MFDVLNETQIDLAEIARQYDVDPSTGFRWMMQGLHGVKLEYARIGKRPVSSREAVARFFARLKEVDDVRNEERAKTPRPAPVPKRFPAARRERQIATAKQELVESGYA